MKLITYSGGQTQQLIIPLCNIAINDYSYI